MNNLANHRTDDTEDPEEINDDEATLADDLLDEVASEGVEEDDAIEGFGILPTKEEDEDDEEDEEGDAELEEDAEDVEFDAFDDIDEL